MLKLRLLRGSLACLAMVVAVLASLLPTGAINAQSGFADSGVWHQRFCVGNEICAVGDVNGDGKDDIIAFVRDSGKVWVALSTGAGFAGSEIWHQRFCLGEAVCTVGDVDGDGRDDIIAFLRGDNPQVWVAISTGAGFSHNPPGLLKDWFCIGEEVCAVGDVDGDGRDDLIAFTRTYSDDPVSGDVWVARSGSGGENTHGEVWNDWFCVGEEVCAVGDVNGDGKDDIIAFTRNYFVNPARGNVWVGLSTGSGFFTNDRQVWHDWFCIGNEICAVGDVNGDGKDDIIAFMRGTSGKVWVALSSSQLPTSKPVTPPTDQPVTPPVERQLQPSESHIPIGMWRTVCGNYDQGTSDHMTITGQITKIYNPNQFTLTFSHSDSGKVTVQPGATAQVNWRSSDLANKWSAWIDNIPCAEAPGTLGFYIFYVQ